MWGQDGGGVGGALPSRINEKCKAGAKNVEASMDRFTIWKLEATGIRVANNQGEQIASFSLRHTSI